MNLEENYMKNNCFIALLSEKFYIDYPKDKYPELLTKENRPYLVCVVLVKGMRFGIPFRTNVKHKYCYYFENSDKITESKTALDFTKAVLLAKDEYIGRRAVIDQKEANELIDNIDFIMKKFERFLDKYNFIVSNPNINVKNGENIKKMTTLKYFL